MLSVTSTGCSAAKASRSATMRGVVAPSISPMRKAPGPPNTISPGAL